MKKIPITHCLPYKATSERVIAAILVELAEMGQHEVVLTESILRDMTSDFSVIATYQKLMADTGMRFCDAHAPFSPKDDLNCPYPELRPMMIERQKQAIQVAASFGVKTITIHIGNNFEKDVTVDQYEANLFDSLEKLLPTAEKFGVTIAIENIWSPQTTGPRILAAIRRFPTEALGVCYDTGHANLTTGRHPEKGNATFDYFHECGLEPEYNDHLLEDLLPHVVNCHLHDNHGWWDEHLPPGFGDVDWEHVIPLLKSAPRIQCYQDESSFSRAKPISIRGRVELFRNLFESDGAIERRP